MHKTLSADVDAKGRIWVASTGGIAIYDDSTILLNTNNGLLSPSINVLKHIPNTHLMLAGSSNGVLEIINEDNLTLQHFTGIRDYNFTSAIITDIIFIDGTTECLISGTFGIAAFDYEKGIFTKSILKMASLSRNTAVNNIILVGDTLWATTITCLVKASINDNISIPSVWTEVPFRTVNGTKFDYTNAKTALINNEIFVIDAKSIYRLNDTERFDVVIKTPYEYRDIKEYNGRLVYSDIYHIYILNDLNDTNSQEIVHTRWETHLTGLAVTKTADAEFVALYEQMGCAFVKYDKTFTLQTPNTPMTNNFMGFALDSKGTLFAVSDNSAIERIFFGFMRYDGIVWTNYVPNLSGFDHEYNFVSIAVSPDDKVYASSWGNGLFIFNNNDDGKTYTQLDHTNSAFQGVNPDSTYDPIGQVCFDNSGKLWAVNYGGGRAGNMLVYFPQQDSSIGFRYTNSRYVFCLAIDINGTKWLGGHYFGSPGLYYFNDRNTPENTDDDIWGNINTASYPNLLQNSFNAMQYDKYVNVVWLGTSSGLVAVNNPSAVFNNGNFALIKNKFLEGQYVYNIFIDAIGNKWISTKNGIWVLSMDASELLAHWTISNTKLTTNDVRAVCINPEDGTLYIGTTNGLFVAQSTVLQPKDNYDKITAYPQPFNIMRDGTLVISGLTANSDIRIITGNGTLIRNIYTSSKEAVWDGKDNNGNKVGAGVYFVVTSSDISNSSAAGKIAVVE